jgi:hypothetical protein
MILYKEKEITQKIKKFFSLQQNSVLLHLDRFRQISLLDLSKLIIK